MREPHCNKRLLDSFVWTWEPKFGIVKRIVPLIITTHLYSSKFDGLLI